MFGIALYMPFLFYIILLYVCGQEKHCTVVSLNDFRFFIPRLQFHYICFGQGFQTWEYSPAYALRSYGYLFLHMIPMQLVQAGNKVHPSQPPTQREDVYVYSLLFLQLLVFSMLRVVFALFCTVCEYYFYK